MERRPTAAEVEQARDRARDDARRRVEDERGRPAADEPIVDTAGPYEFAPEALRAEYERVYDTTLAALRERR